MLDEPAGLAGKAGVLTLAGTARARILAPRVLVTAGSGLAAAAVAAALLIAVPGHGHPVAGASAGGGPAGGENSSHAVLLTAARVAAA